MEIKTGDIGLVQNSTFLAKAIQFFQGLVDKKEGKKYNHAFVFMILYDEIFVVEADKYGIAITPFKEYLDDKKIKSVIGLRLKDNEIGAEGAIKFMLPYVGHTPYDYINLFIYQPIKFLTGKWIGRETDNGHVFICGVWGAYFINNLFPNTVDNESRVAPCDLFENEKFFHYEVKTII
jgi:hypothetical protein